MADGSKSAQDVKGDKFHENSVYFEKLNMKPLS